MSDWLHLGCGENTQREYHNVDQVELPGVDETTDLGTYPWPWDDAQWSHILAEHVFEHLPDMHKTLSECSRILKPGGTLEVVMPIGMNAVADPDHEHVWIWDTPEYYCGKRHWDVDVGLEVVDRGVTVQTHLPGVVGKAYTGFMRAYSHLYGDGRWQFDMPVTSGNFRVVFQK